MILNCPSCFSNNKAIKMSGVWNLFAEEKNDWIGSIVCCVSTVLSWVLEIPCAIFAFVSMALNFACENLHQVSTLHN